MLRRHFLAGFGPLLTGRTVTSQQPLGALETLIGPVLERAASDAEFRVAFVEFAHRRLGTERFDTLISGLMNDAEREVGTKVMGPIIDRIAADDAFRNRFVKYAQQRLGAHGFHTMLYKLMLDARPELRGRPIVLRAMWSLISGGGRWCRSLARC